MLAQASTQPERGTFGFLKYFVSKEASTEISVSTSRLRLGYGLGYLKYYNHVTVQFCDDHTVMSITKFSFTYRQTIML